jgi:hypothetical protein
MLGGRRLGHIAGPIAAVALALGAWAPAALAAPITNGSFETGLTDWIVAPGALAAAVSSHPGEFSTYLPQDGLLFGRLLNLAAGSTSLSRPFTINAGETLRGLAAFDSRDCIDPIDPGNCRNDSGSVRILETNETLFAASVASVGGPGGVGNCVGFPEGCGDGPWTAWSWAAPTGGGTFTLIVDVFEDTTAQFPSAILIDAVHIEVPNPPEPPTAVPAPATLMLIGAGALGLGIRARRRRQF